jgi:hypothetical protein
MPKRKSRKKRVIRQLATYKPLSVPAQRIPNKISNEDLAVGEKITSYHSAIILLACFPTLYILTNLQWIQEGAGKFVEWILAAQGFLVPISIYLNFGFRTPTAHGDDAKGYKRRAVILLAMAIFINLTSWLPIIYALGYFNVFLNLFPGRELLGKWLSLGLAFSLGAIISGVLGNFTYDILKFAFRKMLEKKSKG